MGRPVTISFDLDPEHHISWMYQVEADVELTLKKWGYGDNAITETDFQNVANRRIWKLANVDDQAVNLIEAKLKDAGVSYSITDGAASE